MPSRRRIDWTELPGAQAARLRWKKGPARPDLVALLRQLADLFQARHPDDLLKRAVELALGPVGLVRAGIYLYDARLDLMLGTWGTDIQRRVIDEHHAMFRLGEQGGRVLTRAMRGEAAWTIIQDSPLITNDAKQTRVVGRGWVVCTPICSVRKPLGMLYNDAGLTGARLDPRKQVNASVLCTLVGMLLQEMPRSRGKAFLSGLAAPHPVVTKAVRLLTEDPTLSGSDLAAHLQVSPSSFARVFKSEMGVPLVRYRNQRRLERFLALVDRDRGATSLPEAARAAGFGSYAQFHRVFQSLRGTTPRAYLGKRARA